MVIYSGDENSAHLRQDVGGYYEKRRAPSGAVETLCGWIWAMTDDLRSSGGVKYKLRVFAFDCL